MKKNSLLILVLTLSILGSAVLFSANNLIARNISEQGKTTEAARQVSSQTIGVSPLTLTPQTGSSPQEATSLMAAGPPGTTPTHHGISPQDTVCCPIAGGTAQPWSAGYMDQSATLASEVRVQVSFLNTVQNSIPTGNYIRVGMMAQSQSNGASNCIQTCGTLDWANFAWVQISNAGNPTIVSEVDTSPGYFESSINVFTSNWNCYCYTASDFATLTMRWNNGVLEWLAAINGVDQGVIATYTPYSYQQQVFHVGAESFSLCANLFPCTVKYFQFGIFGQSPVSNPGFQVFIQSPQYMPNGSSTWNDVTKSTSTDGSDALVDKQYAVGGEAYVQAQANYCKNDGTKPFGQILFTESPNFLQSGVLLWDSGCTKANFSFSASPSSININPGQTLCCTLSASLGTLNSYTGGITVSMTGLPNCVTSSIPNPTLLTSEPPISGSGAGFSISLSASTSCPSASTFTGTLTASDAIISHTASFTLQISDFAISASPSTVSLTLAGSSASSTVTVASNAGFSSAVSLAASASPSGPVVSVWPTSVTPSLGGSSISTLDISAGGAAPGTYAVTVTGTSGSLVHSTTVTVTVAGDFSVAASPTTLTLPAGSSGASTITLASLNGFSGTISLASSANVTISAVDIDDGNYRAFGLTIDQALYTPDFWNQQPGSIIGDASSIFTYSHTFPLPTGSHFIEFGVSAWVGHWHAKFWVNGVLMADVDTNVVTHVHVPFQVTGVSVSPSVTNGPTGSLSATSTTLSAAGSSAITLSIATTSSTPAQNYVFTLIASSGGVFHASTVTVKVLDFSLTTNPSSQSLILAGSSTTSTVTVASLNGFSGTVSLTSSSGLVVSLWPNSLTISSGGSATSTLSISAGGATPSTYTVTVGGTGGGLSHSATVTVSVGGDFGISASPTSLSISHGSSGTSTLTLTSLNGFAGTSFAGTITLPSQASISITATSTDDHYQRSFGLLFDQTLNPDFWNSQPGSVIGVSFSPFTFSHTYSLSRGSHFLEFGVSAFVGHWHVQITVNGVVVASVDTDVSHHVHSSFSIGGTSVSPLISNGPTVSLSSNSVTLSSGGSGTITMTISTTHKTPTGNYTVTAIATSGGLSHSITITITVT